MSGHARLGGFLSYAQSEAYETRANLANYVFDSLVTAISSVRGDFESSGLECDVVVNNNHVLCIATVIFQQRFDVGAAFIYKGQRLDQQSWAGPFP